MILTIPTVGYGHRHYESVVRFINIIRHNSQQINPLFIIDKTFIESGAFLTHEGAMNGLF